MPKEFELVKEEVAVCQVIGMARYFEKAVAATSSAATACCIGGVSLGLYAAPEDILDGTRNSGLWGEDAQAARNIMQGKTLIQDGKFQAFGVAPLKTMSIEPDVIQAFGTPEQMLALVYANNWDGGERLGLSTDGHGASCNEALAVPYITGKIRLAIADIGERRQAGARDEMIIGLPLSHLERLVRNLKKLNIHKYPFKPAFAPLPEEVLKRTSARY